MQTIRMLSTLAVMGAFRTLAQRYAFETGVSIDADFAPTVALMERLRGGEQADVVVLTREALHQLSAAGAVVVESCVDLARSYVGVAVRAGAPHPDIATEAALRATLLGAEAVAYSQIGASGIFFAQLIAQMGIASEVNARARIIPSGLTGERLVAGEADLAVQQISELKLVAGVDVVGPILPLTQSPMVFSAGRMAGSAQPARSDALLKFLVSSEATSALRQSGLEP